MAEEYMLTKVCDERSNAYMQYFKNDKENITMLTAAVNQLSANDVKLTALTEESNHRTTALENHSEKLAERVTTLERKPGESWHKAVWAVGGVLLAGFAMYFFDLLVK